jgi:2'-5' RNA ligase
VDSYRTFIAIELPRELRVRVIEHIDRLRRDVPDVRASWLREGNLHLTLKFLGNVSVTRIADVSDAITRAVSDCTPFALTVGGCGVFPPRGRPNVLWIGVLPSRRSTDDGSYRGFSQHPIPNTQNPEFPRHRTPDTRDPLFLLYSAIEDACATAGFPPEQRAFHPHLTIARLRKAGERRLAQAHQSLGFAPDTFSVSEVVVFKSELLREGSKHTPISRHALKG